MSWLSWNTQSSIKNELLNNRMGGKYPVSSSSRHWNLLSTLPSEGDPAVERPRDGVGGSEVFVDAHRVPKGIKIWLLNSDFLECLHKIKRNLFIYKNKLAPIGKTAPPLAINKWGGYLHSALSEKYLPEKSMKLTHLEKSFQGVPVVAQWLTNPTKNFEVVGSIPGLAQWVKDLALPWAVV